MTAHPIHAMFDRAEPKAAFKRARKVEAHYSSMLRRVAKHVGDIVAGFPLGEDGGFSHSTIGRITETLRRYSDTIRSWAEATADRMVKEVAARDESAWMAVSRKMGRSLRKEIATAPIGGVVRQRLADQVDLITSLPREAAERVHKLTLEGVVQGTRPAEIAAEIMKTGDVTKSRAMLIARTEVARTASELTIARAKHVGATHYRWRTSGDSDVRPDHRVLDGKVFAFDEPPVADRRTGARAHPGCIYRCRCWIEPLLLDD